MNESLPPPRVAVVGAGPSGFYAAAEILRLHPTARVDLFERLFAPHGLVRYGVAPDHAKTKAVTRAFDRVAADPRVMFRGNVRVGADVPVAELREAYTAVLFAHGADAGRPMGIPGESLANVFPSVDFVGWYNGHPDHQGLHPRLDHPVAVVVGNGNVALDVARLLARPAAELRATDIASPALDALAGSAIRRVVVLGRRGPAQAAFTPVELAELSELPGVRMVVHPADLELSPEDEQEVAADATGRLCRCLDILRGAADRPAAEGARTLEFRFLTSPVALEGVDRLRSVTLSRNRLEGPPGSRKAAVIPGRIETLEAGLLVSSTGYRGARIEGLPFDERGQVVPSQNGRVAGMPGVYCAGWIRRGAQGVIGNNKRDAAQTVATLMADLPALEGRNAPGIAPATLAARGVREISWSDWSRLDARETAEGETRGCPRLKTLSLAEALAFLG